MIGHWPLVTGHFREASSKSPTRWHNPNPRTRPYRRHARQIHLQQLPTLRIILLHSPGPRTLRLQHPPLLRQVLTEKLYHRLQPIPSPHTHTPSPAHPRSQRPHRRLTHQAKTRRYGNIRIRTLRTRKKNRTAAALTPPKHRRQHHDPAKHHHTATHRASPSQKKTKRVAHRKQSRRIIMTNRCNSRNNTAAQFPRFLGPSATPDFVFRVSPGYTSPSNQRKGP